MPPGILLKYIGVLLGIMLLTKLVELRKKNSHTFKNGIDLRHPYQSRRFAYSAGLNGIECINLWQTALISSLEGVAAFAMVFVFNYAVRIFLYHKSENTLSNEEQISLGITLGAVCVCIPRLSYAYTFCTRNAHIVCDPVYWVTAMCRRWYDCRGMYW